MRVTACHAAILRALLVALAVALAGASHAVAAETGAGLDARQQALADQDFRTGLSAYSGADYEVAFSHWLPWALRGDAKSEAALAFLYMRGLGVPQDRLVAAQWYERAAQQGVPIAQFFLGSLLFRGEGVERDLVGAHMWCDLALSAGFEPALDCRQQIAGTMTGAQIAEAQRRVVEWRKAKGE